MNLLDLRAAHPKRFYPQDWFRDQRFMRRVLTFRRTTLPRRVLLGVVPNLDAVGLPPAVTMAHLFLLTPDDDLWRGFFWCDDRDHIGQRIYVGGVCAENDMRFEIHRHLHITSKWSTALW